jgi:hypothetical protein
MTTRRLGSTDTNILLVKYGDFADNGGFPYLGTLTPNTFANMGDDLWSLGHHEPAQSYSHDRNDFNPDSQNQTSLDATQDDPVRSPPRNMSYRALEPEYNCSTQFIGFSNESDPFLLDHFPYNENHEVEFFQVRYRTFPTTIVPSGQTQSASTPVPIHFLQSQVKTASEAIRVVKGSTSGLNHRENLETIVDRVAGVALVKLYVAKSIVCSKS